MKSKGRTHRFTPSLWIGFLLLGVAVTLLAIGTVVYNFDDLIGGQMSLLDYIAFFLMLPFMISWGVFFLATLIFTKVVTSPQGLEYHTLAYTIKVNWQEIKNLPNDETARQQASVSEPQASPCSHVEPRRWTRLVGVDVEKRAMKQGIPLYMFGGYRGCQLMADVRKYAPQLDI